MLIVLDLFSNPLALLGFAALLMFILSMFFIWSRWSRVQKEREANKFKTEFKREALNEVGIEYIRPKASSTSSVGIAKPKSSTPKAEALPSKEVGLDRLNSGTISGEKTKVYDKKDEDVLEVRPVAKPRVQVMSAAPKPMPASNAPTIKPPALPNPELRHVFEPIVQAVRAATNAHSVVLLRIAEGGLQVEAIVSGQMDIKRRIQIPSNRSFFSQVQVAAAVTVLSHAEIGITPDYYETQVFLTAMAIAPIRVEGQIWGYLLADFTEHYPLTNPNVLASFAQTLTPIIIEHSPKAKPIVPPTVWTGNPVRPRREIIAEEMRQARANGTPLVFALIYLNQNAYAHQELTSDVIVTWESRMWDAAARSLKGKGKVERFGELMLGVFIYGTAYVAETWIAAMQDTLSADLRVPMNGISIGAVFMQQHHNDPEVFLKDTIETLKQVQAGGAALLE